ncbi:MAG: hypothetical protein Q9220_003684 [cf. Caloplaca sp. 1 TL-2023]
MLLDEDPATLIHHTIGNFNIHPDKVAIGRINESLTTLQQARDLRIREADNALRKLSRNLQTLSSQHTETIASHNSTAHASQIVELDTQKFRVAKAASDLEIEGERLEQELESLNGRLHELDVQGIEGDDAAKAKREAEDPTIMGSYNKATIRSTQKGDVHVVNIDPKFSRFFYANYFWQAL